MYLKFSTCALFWIFILTVNTTKTTPNSLMKKKFIPKKSICHSHLCTNSTFYPKKAIKRLLTRNKKRFDFLSGSVIEPIKDMTPAEIYRGPEIEENMCRTRRVSKIPLTAFDVKKRLKYIVNVEEFKQIITYETCVDAEKSCFGNDLSPNDFVTFCKQAFTMVRLLSVSHLGRLEYAYFPVPSNCICSYRKLNSYDYR